jgi:hypothetical protein
MTKIVYLITPRSSGKNAKSFWNRAGIAFENKDGSLNVKLDMFPNLQFQIRDKNVSAKEPKL